MEASQTNKRYKAVLYVSKVNWKTQEELDDASLEQQIENCKQFIADKGSIDIVYTLRSNGEKFPYDPVFLDFRKLIINRYVDCVVVPSFFYFNSRYTLAKSWVKDVFFQAGFRYIDIAEHFDSLACNHSKYLSRVQQTGRKPKSRNISNKGKGEENG